MRLPVVVLGLILILAAVVSVVFSESVGREAGSVYLLQDMRRGQDMADESSAMRYGGFAVGGIGLVLLGVGLVSRPRGNQAGRYAQPLPPIGPRYCTNCGTGVRQGAHFCTDCGITLSEVARPPIVDSTSSPPSLHCLNCGAAVPHEASFCVGCGTPLKKLTL